ncbi:MAG: cysteine desulfurase [Oligoflexia bacterium]|nr:MAG: cysteine desulfurase [Oligoflexia bacterium]
MLEKTQKTRIYLDHNATTPVGSDILSKIVEVADIWGNPSSIHWAGRGPKALIRESRQHLASALSVSPLELIFTSGGSEANATVIRSIFDEIEKTSSPRFGRNEFVTTQIEHPSVLKAFQWIEERGAKVTYLTVDRDGNLNLELYEKVISEKTALVSIMYANNETGVVFPIQKLAKIAHERGALFHSDCVQALGKVSLNLAKMGIDYASFSGHKVYSLKGTGFLYARKNCPIEPLIFGSHERHRRGGTENTLGIWSLGVMAQKLSTVSEIYPRITLLRDQMEEQIQKTISGVKITSKSAHRLPNTSSMVIEGVDGETLLMSLDMKGIAVSTGAACSSGSPEPSPVLLAIGLSRQEAQSSLRVSLGWKTTPEEIQTFIDILSQVVQRLRTLEQTQKELDHV